MEPDEFLDRARVTPGVHQYVVGAWDSNITLYRQQIRALNLIYALKVGKTGLPLGSTIAIIGAGAFGVTAAVAAASIGYKVVIYEQHQMILPMQRGCDTRWVNPRYYEWPDAGSDARYAVLPLMAWQSGSADQVAEQLSRTFQRHKDETGRIKLILDTIELTVRPSRGGFRVECRYRRVDGHMETEDPRVDAVIYAVGFGVEADYEQNTPSYWHNDDLAQVELRQRDRHYLISGLGDGGLTDLARLKVRRFRHERIFHELFDKLPPFFLKRLQEMRTQPADASPDWLYGQFEALEKAHRYRKYMDLLIDEVRGRLRGDTHVWVNSKHASFSDALTLRQVSLTNAFLAFLIYRAGGFEYHEGTLGRSTKPNGWILTPAAGPVVRIPPGTTVVVRHGTSSAGALEAVGIEVPPAERVEFHGSDQPIYELGWWGLNRIPKSGRKNPPVNPVEFVAPASVVMATGFINTVADVLIDRHDDAVKAARLAPPAIPSAPPDSRRALSPTFRFTIHRVVRSGDESFFQQLGPYAGLLKNGQESENSIGRVFPADAGIGGLSITTGGPVLFRRPEGESLDLMKKLIKFKELKARPIEKDVDSIFACPLFSAGPENRVAYMLFADSSELGFFGPEVLTALYAASRGFVKNLDLAIQNGRMSQTPGVNIGHLVTPHDLDIDELADAGITLDDPQFENFADDLKFAVLESTELDIIDRVPDV